MNYSILYNKFTRELEYRFSSLSLAFQSSNLSLSLSLSFLILIMKQYSNSSSKTTPDANFHLIPPPCHHLSYLLPKGTHTLTRVNSLHRHHSRASSSFPTTTRPASRILNSFQETFQTLNYTHTHINIISRNCYQLQLSLSLQRDAMTQSGRIIHRSPYNSSISSISSIRYV